MENLKPARKYKTINKYLWKGKTFGMCLKIYEILRDLPKQIVFRRLSINTIQRYNKLIKKLR